MERKFISILSYLFAWICTFAIGSPLRSQSPHMENMKEIRVPRIEHQAKSSIHDVKEILTQHTELHSIEVINWPEFPYRPDVEFRIAHVGDALWLVFYVTENHILARQTRTNSATHLDSCVEFFIDPRKDGNYYNFEFNAIGTIHLAHGPNVRERRFLDPDLIESQIITYSSLGDQPLDRKNGVLSWDLSVIIPASILVHEEIEDWSGTIMHGNFFKCGDETDTPHFLSWNPIQTERPSFHQPTFFGRLVFE